MPQSRGWGVLATRADGALVSIEDHGGWAYRDRAAYDRQQMEGDSEGLIGTEEFSWVGGENCVRSLSVLLDSSGDYFPSGGGIWLANYVRPDGKFAVIGVDGGSVYPSREAYNVDIFADEDHGFF